MVACVISGIALRGIVAAVPESREESLTLVDRFGIETMRRIVAATGISARHVAPPTCCTSDLAAAAAEHLLDRLSWSRTSIDVLVLVTQTPDQKLPASACLLHHRLGLSKECAVFDLTLGCSGFVYGLWVASSLLKSLQGRGRALVLAGDTTARLCAADDRTVVPLFGDAATATAIEVDAQAEGAAFVLGTDGAGAPYLSVAGGGERDPRAERRLFMDGTQVFAFTLREVPDSLRAVLTLANWSIDDVDRLVLHQANAQLIRHLGQKIGIEPERVVVALSEFGNTSSASIPLACASAVGVLERQPLKLLLSGFGVGWSWASAALSVGPLGVCSTVIVPPDR